MFPFSEKIQKDGKLQIHFDGWGSNYDYVIEPTSTNIHPVGWMDANKHAHKISHKNYRDQTVSSDHPFCYYSL